MQSKTTLKKWSAIVLFLLCINGSIDARCNLKKFIFAFLVTNASIYSLIKIHNEKKKDECDLLTNIYHAATHTSAMVLLYGTMCWGMKKMVRCNQVPYK